MVIELLSASGPGPWPGRDVGRLSGTDRGGPWLRSELEVGSGLVKIHRVRDRVGAVVERSTSTRREVDVVHDAWSA